MDATLDISVVVPLYNEEESLPELVEWIDRVARGEGLSYEVILVDDGSGDGSWRVIESLHERFAAVRGIKFARNYGKSAALYCGFAEARGEVVFTMDADLQDSPDEIPELRRDILRESMFDWECRHCGYTAQMAYPMIYHDPMNAFMICLRPSGAVSGAEPIPAVRALKKRSVKNPQELKEKILIFEAGLDDAAVELVKNAIVTVVRKNLDGNVHAYFCAATEEELRFALFVKGRQEPVYQTTKMAVYRQSQEVLRTLDYKSPDDFAVVNSKLAQSLLDEYKSI